MEENGRIEKRIIKHLFQQKRATKDKLLNVVRRDGLPRTTKQELNQRIEWLKNSGVIRLLFGSKKHEVYILVPEKRVELEVDGLR